MLTVDTVNTGNVNADVKTGSLVVPEAAESESESESEQPRPALKRPSPMTWIRSNWRAVLVTIAASVGYSFAVVYFTLYYHFPDLGLTGIAVLSTYIFGISPNWLNLGGNLLMVVWGRKDLNARFLFLTCISFVTMTIALPIFQSIPLPLPEDEFMGAVIGGLLKGVCTGILFNVGGSSGGTDIVGAVLRRRYDLEVGRFTIVINFLILALSVEIVGLEAVVYGAIGVYASGVTMDNVTRTFDKRKQAFIITNIPDEVAKYITGSMGRGVTLLEGRGAYTGQARPVLMTLLTPRQVVHVKHFLRDRDPKAFVSICDASEVVGQGFKSWKSL